MFDLVYEVAARCRRSPDLKALVQHVEITEAPGTRAAIATLISRARAKDIPRQSQPLSTNNRSRFVKRINRDHTLSISACQFRPLCRPCVQTCGADIRQESRATSPPVPDVNARIASSARTRSP
jgi:hypothetical protein